VITNSDWLSTAGLVVIASPLILTSALGGASLIGRSLSERATTRWVFLSTSVGLLAAITVLAGMLLEGTRNVEIQVGNWVAVHHLFHFSIKFVFDRLSVPLAILSFVLSGTVGAFATRYLHREPGFNRFFVLYSIFQLGMIITSLAGTIETLFTGWELVGLSSALLVTFFLERPSPARNGLWTWSVYRISDAALLLAAVALHHMRGEGDFQGFLGVGAWPDEHSMLTPQQAVVVGLLLLAAAAGKSAMIPFSGWLPRAMEGPTPSSAVFYGALSVHLGAFLLMRISPLFELSPWLAAAVVAMGLTTAVYAYVAGSVQTDIKSVLSFASLVQVGLIVAEIGIGFRYLALVHLLGHACLRTLQFVRAPTLLQDYQILEDAMGGALPRHVAPWARVLPTRVNTWLYRVGLERGFLDTLLLDYIVTPFMNTLRWCDRQERRWTDFIAGERSREDDISRAARLRRVEEFS
jgi:NAD(P)H-quinone oxidoreductase subunit 5